MNDIRTASQKQQRLCTHIGNENELDGAATRHLLPASVATSTKDHAKTVATKNEAVNQFGGITHSARRAVPPHPGSGAPTSPGCRPALSRSGVVFIAATSLSADQAAQFRNERHNNELLNRQRNQRAVERCQAASRRYPSWHPQKAPIFARGQ